MYVLNRSDDCMYNSLGFPSYWVTSAQNMTQIGQNYNFGFYGNWIYISHVCIHAPEGLSAVLDRK